MTLLRYYVITKSRYDELFGEGLIKRALAFVAGVFEVLHKGQTQRVNERAEG